MTLSEIILIFILGFIGISLIFLFITYISYKLRHSDDNSNNTHNYTSSRLTFQRQNKTNINPNPNYTSASLKNYYNNQTYNQVFRHSGSNLPFSNHYKYSVYYNKLSE